ncbi:MAG: AsmA-like C-terminal domain-containing protein [Nitrospinota bacterium]
MKWIKKGAIGFLVLAALYFGAIELIKRQFEPEVFRQKLVEYVQSEFNAKLDIFTIQTAPFSRFGLIARAVKLDGAGMHFSVEKATFTVSPLSLLFGKVVITDLSLEKPMALLRRFKTGRWNIEKLLKATGKRNGPTAVLLKKVFVTRGGVTVIDEHVNGSPAVYRFSLVDLVFRSKWLYPSSNMLLSARMESKQEPSTLMIKLYSGSAFPFRNWLESQLDGKINLQSVKPGELQHYIGRYFPKEILNKKLNFNLEFKGVPSKSIKFDTELLFRPSDVEAGGLISTKAHKGYRRIEASGNLSPDNIAIERVSIVLPEITVKGDMDVNHYLAEDPEVQFRFHTSFADISRLKALVPPAYRAEPMIRFMEQNIERGLFRLTEASFAGPYSRFLNLDDPDNLGMLSGKMEVKDFTLRLETFDHPVEHVNGIILLKPGELTFSGISADYGPNRLKNITGDILNIHSEPLLRAIIDADLDLDDFQKELLANIGSPNLLAVFKPVKNLGGKIGFNFNIAVDLHRQLIKEFDGVISLQECEFSHEYFHLPVRGLNGSLRVNRSNIYVQDVTWSTGSSVFNINGRIKDYSSSEYYIKFSFDVNGELSEFAKSRFYTIPFMEDYKGRVNAKLNLEGDFFEMKFSQKADFTNAEFGIHGLKKMKGIPSRQRLTGSIYKGRRMRIEYGEANIGKLVLSLTGDVENIIGFNEYKLAFKLKQYGLKYLSEIMPSFSSENASGRLSGGASIDKSGGNIGYKYWFNTKFKKLDVSPLSSVSPLLTRINPKGVFTGWIKARGENGKPFSGTGELEGEGIGFKTKLKEPFRGLAGKGTLNGNQFKISYVNGMVGDSRGTVVGIIKLKSKPKTKLMLNLSVNAETLNLYDFVALKKKEKEEGEAGRVKKTKPVINVHPAFHLNIRSEKGSIHFLDYTDLTASFNYNEHFFDFQDFSFVSNEGRWTGKGTLNTKDKKNIFETDMSVTGVNLKTFLPLLWEGTDKLTGKLDLKGRFEGEGLPWSKLRHTLDGEARFTAKKGILAEHPGAAVIFTILNVVPIFEKRTKEQKGVGIPYETITGTMKIKDGAGHTEDTMLEGSVVRMSAVGDVRFNDGTLDILLGVKPFTTVDRIISKIPVAGKILTGKEKSLITHYYKITGKFEDMKTESLPSESIGRSIFGIIKRILDVPGKVLSGDIKKKETAKPKPKDEGGQ